METLMRESIPTDKAIDLLMGTLSKAREGVFDLNAWRSYTISIFERIFGSQSKKIEEVEKMILSSFLEPEFYRPQAIAIIEAAISEIKLLGVPDKNTYGAPGVLVNVHQSQEITINQLKDTIKDEFTGKQFKEIQEIAKSNRTPEQKKKTITEKIKSFGSDVASNILANILANPNFYQTLF